MALFIAFFVSLATAGGGDTETYTSCGSVYTDGTAGFDREAGALLPLFTIESSPTGSSDEASDGNQSVPCHVVELSGVPALTCITDGVGNYTPRYAPR